MDKLKVGDRILYGPGPGTGIGATGYAQALPEATVGEISPSGKYVLLRTFGEAGDYKDSWWNIDHVRVIEQLQRPPEPTFPEEKRTA